jgi:alcohol dehydrogenase class IV
MRCAARSLRRAYACGEQGRTKQGDDAAAREDMMLASLFGGLALANAKLGAVHGFAGPMGGMFPAPHGAVCASLLPHAMAVNVQALRERLPMSESLHRYDEIARILTGSDKATAGDGVAWVQELCQALRVPSLASYGGRCRVSLLGLGGRGGYAGQQKDERPLWKSGIDS